MHSVCLEYFVYGIVHDCTCTHTDQILLAYVIAYTPIFASAVHVNSFLQNYALRIFSAKRPETVPAKVYITLLSDDEKGKEHLLEVDHFAEPFDRTTPNCLFIEDSDVSFLNPD